MATNDQSAEQSIQDIIEQVRRINKSTTKLKEEIRRSLSERDAKYFEFEDKLRTTVQSNEKIKSGAVEKKILETLEEIAEAGPARDSESVTREKDQISLMKDLLKAVEDPENKKLLKEQIKEVEKLHADNSEIFVRTTDFLKNQFDSLSGVVLGVFADSPIIGIATSMLGSMIKESLERKRQQKLEKAKTLKERKLELEQKREEMALLLQQLEEMKANDENIRDLKPEIVDLKGETSKGNDILSHVADVLEGDGAQKKKDEEARREQAALFERIADSLEEKSDKTKKKPGEEEEGDEAFSVTALKVKLLDILGRWTSGLFKGLMSVASAIPLAIAGAAGKGIKTLGRMLFVTLPKTLMRLIPPVFIVTTLFSGIDDGLREFKESGSIQKALTAFFGGIVEFLSFGMFTKDDVESASKTASTAVADFFEWVFSEEGIPKVWNSIKTSFSTFAGSLVKTAEDNINEIVGLIDDIFNLQPIKDQLESIRGTITDWIEGVANFFKNFDLEKKINELLPDFLKSETENEEKPIEQPIAKTEEAPKKKEEKGFFSRLFSFWDDEDESEKIAPPQPENALSQADLLAKKNEERIVQEREIERQKTEKLQNIINSTNVDSRKFSTHNHIMQPSASNPDPVLNRLQTAK